jgi:hypothetical protein
MYVETPDTFLDDFGVPCTFGATNFTGLFDVPDQVFELGGTSIQSNEFRLTFRTSDVSLARGNSITVAGVSYFVRSPPNTLDDGTFTAVTLTKV